MKKKILTLFSKLIFKYGINGAKQPSYRGTFEPKVPDILVNATSNQQK